jgi:hypothetical protein
LFQNCRSTRETELFKITGGNVKAVCAWIGNSPEVAMKHYAQVTEADMKEAAKMIVLNDAEKTVHNPVQPTAESECKEVQDEKESIDINLQDCSSLQEFAGPCTDMQNPAKWAGLESNQRRLTPTGLQPVPFGRSGTDPNSFE